MTQPIVVGHGKSVHLFKNTKTIRKSLKQEYKNCFLPIHCRPFPVNPFLQTQVKFPKIFLQFAFL